MATKLHAVVDPEAVKCTAHHADEKNPEDIRNTRIDVGQQQNEGHEQSENHLMRNAPHDE